MIARAAPLLLLVLLPPAMFSQAPRTAAKPQPRFADVTASAKIAFVHESGASPDKRMVETFGSGVAWIDYDNDGFADLFFVNGAPGSSNALYRNNGDGTFMDVTTKAGVAGAGPGKTVFKTGVAVGDYDNNGYLDLYVTAFGPNVLYKNNGDGTFTDVTTAAGVAGGAAEWSTSTGFFDYDRDGNLDLYVVNYLDYRLDDSPYCGLRKDGYRMYCLPTLFDGMPDRLFHNNGDGTFTDVSKKAGIANPAGKGLGVVFCDYDRDGDQDVYIANDMVRNFLYRNNGDGTFLDVAYGAGVGFDVNGKPQAGMGVDCGDYDENGYPDLFVTNFADELNTLYENRGGGAFEDVTTRAGLGSGFGPLGFGTKMFDIDNDGDLDLHVTNGHVVDNVKLYQPNQGYAQKDLLLRESRRQVRRRDRGERARASGRARRPRTRRRGLRQRRPSRRRHLERREAAGAAAQSGRARQLAPHPRAGAQRQHLRDGRDRPGADAVGAAGARDQQHRELSERERRAPARGRRHRESRRSDRDPVAERHEADPEKRRGQPGPGDQGTLILPVVSGFSRTRDCCSVRLQPDDFEPRELLAPPRHY